MTNSPFVHLRARSSYSLLEGAIHVKELVKLAVSHDMPALAITDNANLFGSLEFSQAASAAGVQPIMGCLLQVKPWEARDARHPAMRVPDQLLVLAKDETGYHNLLKLVSKAYVNPADGDSPLVSYDDVRACAAGMIALTGGPQGGVGRALSYGRETMAEEVLLSLREAFGDRLYIELHRHGLEAERKIEGSLIRLAQMHNVPMVATNDIYFAGEDMFEAHDALNCIASGKYVNEANRLRLTPEHRFKSPEEMQLLFADIPEAIANTAVIARRCAFMSESRKPMLPSYEMRGESGEILDEAEALRARAREGLEARLAAHVFTASMSEAEKEEAAKPYRERLEFELSVIINMQFPGYFLIVSDFITWSKRQGIPVGPGRGSGAGSVVAWALLITDLDPLRYGLLFERFLNPERVSMPDFDVDFCQDRRDEVIRYVQEKYGPERVAQIITFGKLQARAVLRDVGRVLQLPYGQVDRICKLVPNNPANPVTLQQAIDMEPLLRAAIEEDESVERMVTMALKLEGLYRHASTHAAGVVIADRALEELVPLYSDPKSDMLVVQYSMKYAESAGLVKFDFLGLKTLSVLKKAVEMVGDRSIQIDLLTLPEGDKKTYAMLSQGDTLGVFQLESAGMRDTLKKLKPDSLEDIIALVSLYRPGPMDNIPTYIARKHGLEKPRYLHPKLEEVLRETYGVIIYQEQVMTIAQLLAGYSLGEADLLRRAMGKKIRSEMEAQRDIFVTRAVERGVEKAQAKSIFELIAKFAEYGFNKSHAAAYAVIAYQTAYMKANYPVEFFAATMTYDMHNTDKLGIYRQEAAKYGIAILPPDVNASCAAFAVEEPRAASRESRDSNHETQATPSLAIRYALAAVKGVGEQAMEELVRERQENGPYKDMFDFAGRLGSHVLNRKQLENLVRAGVFDGLNPNRRQLFESIDTLIAFGNAKTRERESQQSNLFGGASVAEQAETLPALKSVADWNGMERLQEEAGAIGFYLSSHPLEGYQAILARMGVVNAALLNERLDRTYRTVKLAGIVTSLKSKVSQRGRFAFVQMSDATGLFEVSIFDEALLQSARPLLEPGSLILVNADGKADDNGLRLSVKSIQKLDDDIARFQQQQRGAVGTLRISLTPQAPLPALKDGLGQAMAKGFVVILSPTLASGEKPHIKLPGYYMLSPATIRQLKTMPGMIEIVEAA